MCRVEDETQQARQSGPPTLVKNEFLPYRLAAAYLQKKLDQAGLATPTIGVVCGSGLSGLSEALEGKKITVKYGDIPGFPAHCTVAGHKGEVVFGLLNGVPAMCFRGRFHFYEGHDMKLVVLPVYVMRCLGVRVVLITNAAGGLNPEYNVGDVVCVTDHLAIPQLSGSNPLIGPNDDELGPRFPATSNAYPAELRSVAMKAAEELGYDFCRPSGTYCFVAGPMYESKAECRFLRALGGDLVGMSTVPEIVAAHHCNMQVLCLSLVTNKVVTEDAKKGEIQAVATHQEVLEAVAKRSVQMQSMIQQIVAGLGRSVLPKLPPLTPVNLHVAPLEAVLPVAQEGNAKEEPLNKANKKGAFNISLPLESVVMSAVLLAVGAFAGSQLGC